MKQPAVLFCFFISSIFTLFSCNVTVPQEYEYYYYPSRNIYYDVSNHEYIYSLNGGQSWDSALVFTDKEPTTLGVKQIIKSKTPDVWVHNAEHIRQYNGHVINVMANNTDSQEDLVSERKVKKVVKPVADNKEPEKKPGFFKRIFGKKNK